jgi:hypothetical protein
MAELDILEAFGYESSEPPTEIAPDDATTLEKVVLSMDATEELEDLMAASDSSDAEVAESATPVVDADGESWEHQVTIETPEVTAEPEASFEPETVSEPASEDAESAVAAEGSNAAADYSEPNAFESEPAETAPAPQGEDHHGSVP